MEYIVTFYVDGRAYQRTMRSYGDDIACRVIPIEIAKQFQSSVKWLRIQTDGWNGLRTVLEN